VGLLFDPRRPREEVIAQRLKTSLRSTGLTVRFNYPYRGTSDGLTTAMRAWLPSTAYMGIEIEINQALLVSRLRREAAQTLSAAVETVLFSVA
jgi:N-formylglutamate amidohydrolase.